MAPSTAPGESLHFARRDRSAKGQAPRNAGITPACGKVHLPVVYDVKRERIKRLALFLVQETRKGTVVSLVLLRTIPIVEQGQTVGTVTEKGQVHVSAGVGLLSTRPRGSHAAAKVWGFPGFGDGAPPSRVMDVSKLVPAVVLGASLVAGIAATAHAAGTHSSGRPPTPGQIDIIRFDGTFADGRVGGTIAL